MRARWKLGRALKAVQREPGLRSRAGSSSSALTSLLTELALTRQTALEAQRIGAMPEDKLIKAFVANSELGLDRG